MPHPGDLRPVGQGSLLAVQAAGHRPLFAHRSWGPSQLSRCAGQQPEEQNRGWAGPTAVRTAVVFSFTLGLFGL